MKDGQHTRLCEVPWAPLYTTKESAQKDARDMTRNSVSIVYEVKQCSNCQKWYILASGEK